MKDKKVKYDNITRILELKEEGTLFDTSSKEEYIPGLKTISNLKRKTYMRH